MCVTYVHYVLVPVQVSWMRHSDQIQICSIQICVKKPHHQTKVSVSQKPVSNDRNRGCASPLTELITNTLTHNLQSTRTKRDQLQ